jgi:hypothetical protein
MNAPGPLAEPGLEVARTLPKGTTGNPLKTRNLQLGELTVEDIRR